MTGYPGMISGSFEICNGQNVYHSWKVIGLAIIFQDSKLIYHLIFNPLFVKTALTTVVKWISNLKSFGHPDD
jgi:hypothetical protein